MHDGLICNIEMEAHVLLITICFLKKLSYHTTFKFFILPLVAFSVTFFILPQLRVLGAFRNINQN